MLMVIKKRNMKKLSVTLLSNRHIWVGEIPQEATALHTFHLYKMGDLPHFFEAYPDAVRYFNQAVAYWILCKLGFRKFHKQQYGFITRYLTEFSKDFRIQLLGQIDRVSRELRKVLSAHKHRKKPLIY